MKKWMIFPVLAIAALIVYFGCQQDEGLVSMDNLTTQAKAERPIVDMGGTATLRFGNRVSFEPGDFTIYFKSVVEDSRCPANVNCIWEGKAVLEFELEGLDEYTLVKIETPNSRNENGNKVNFLGYTIELQNLMPYPEVNTTISTKEYQATIKIDRGEIINDDKS